MKISPRRIIHFTKCHISWRLVIHEKLIVSPAHAHIAKMASLMAFAKQLSLLLPSLYCLLYQPHLMLQWNHSLFEWFHFMFRQNVLWALGYFTAILIFLSEIYWPPSSYWLLKVPHHYKQLYDEPLYQEIMPIGANCKIISFTPIRLSGQMKSHIRFGDSRGHYDVKTTSLNFEAEWHIIFSPSSWPSTYIGMPSIIRGWGTILPSSSSAATSCNKYRYLYVIYL